MELGATKVLLPLLTLGFHIMCSWMLLHGSGFLVVVASVVISRLKLTTNLKKLQHVSNSTLIMPHLFHPPVKFVSSPSPSEVNHGQARLLDMASYSFCVFIFTGRPRCYPATPPHPPPTRCTFAQRRGAPTPGEVVERGELHNWTKDPSPKMSGKPGGEIRVGSSDWKFMWRLQVKRQQIIKQHMATLYLTFLFPISYFGMEFGNRIILLESKSGVRMLAFANFPLIILDHTLPW